MGEARGSGRGARRGRTVAIRGVAGVTALLPLVLAENYAMALDTTQQSVHGHGGPLCAIKLSAIMANHNVIVTHGTRPQRRIQVYAGCLYVAQSGRLDAG